MSVRSSCSSTEARVQPHTVTPNFWHRKLVDHTQPNKTAASTGNAVASATTSSAALFIRPDVAAVLTSGAAHTTINKVPVHLDTTPAQDNAGQEKTESVAAPRPAECASTAAAALSQPHRHRRRGGAHSRATSAAESNGIASPSLAAGTTSFMMCAAPAASSEAVGTSNTAVNSGPTQAPDHVCETAAAASSLTVDTQSSSCTGGVTTTTTATETQGNRNASEEPARQEEVKQAVVHKHAKNTSITKVKGPASIEELRALRNRTIPLAGSNSATASANHASNNNSNAAQPSVEENEVIEEISKLLLHYCVGRDRKRVVDTTTTTAGPGPGVVLFPKPASLPSSLAPLDSGMPSGPHRVLKPNKQPHYTKDIVLPSNTTTTTQSADPASQSSSTTEPKSLDVTHWPTLEEAAAAARAGRQHKATTRSSNSSGLSTPSPAQKPNTAEDNTSQKEKGSDEQKAMPSPEPTPALANTTDTTNPPATGPAVQPTRSASSNENTAAASAGGVAVAPSPSPATTTTTATNTTTNRAGNSLPMASSASHVEDDEDDPVAQELELYSQLVRLYQTKKVTLSTLTLVHEMLLHTRVIPHMSNASGFAGQPHNNSVTSRRRSYLQQLIMVLLNEMMQQKYKEECQRNATGSTGEGQLPLHPPLPIHPPVLPIPSRAGRGPHATMPVMPSSTLPPALLGATPSIHVGPRPHNNNNSNNMNSGTASAMPMWDMPNTRAAGGPSSGSKGSRRRGNNNSNNAMASVSPSESNSASFALSTGPPLQGCGQSPYPPMMMPNGLFMPPAPMMWPPFAATPTGAPMPSAEPQSCTTVFPRQVVGPMSMSESRASGTLGRPAVHTLRPDAVAPPSSAMTFHPLTGMLTAPPCAERPQFDLHALTAKPKKSKQARNTNNEEDSDDASDEMDEEEDEVQDLLKFINEQAEAEAVKGFASCPPTPAESPSQQRIPSTPEGITPTVNISQAERIILRTVQLDFKERAKQQSAALVAPLSLPPAAGTTNTNATTEEILFDFDAERAEVTRPIFDSPRETCEDATMPTNTNTNTEAAAVDMNATDEVKEGQSMQEPQQPSFHFAEAANQADDNEESSSRVRAEGSPQEESTCRALLFAEREAAETRVEMSSTAQPSLHTTSHTETSASRQAESEMNDSAALGPCESGVIGQGRHEAATLPLPINAQPLLELGKMDFRPSTTSVTPPPSTTGTTQEEKPEKVGGDAFVMSFVPARPPRHHNRGGRSRRRGKEANARSRQQQQELFAAPRMRAPSVPPTSLNTNAAPFVPITGNAAAVPFYELSPRPHMINTAASRRSVGSTLNRDAAPFVPMHIPPMEPPMAMPYFL